MAGTASDDEFGSKLSQLVGNEDFLAIQAIREKQLARGGAETNRNYERTMNEFMEKFGITDVSEKAAASELLVNSSRATDLTSSKGSNFR